MVTSTVPLSSSTVLLASEALTDDDVLKSGQLWDEIVTTMVYPSVRLLAALVVVWFASSFSKYVYDVAAASCYLSHNQLYNYPSSYS